MAIVGRALLVAVDRRLGAVDIENHLFRQGERGGFGDPGAVEGGERVDVLVLSKDVALLPITALIAGSRDRPSWSLVSS